MLLSALAGAIHVLAPDHWVPASILSWQRRWRAPATALFSTAALVMHVMLGAALYFLLEERLHRLSDTHLLSYALTFVVAVMLVRGLRFSRIHDVQKQGSSWWGMLGVVSLLGPCESIIPIFVKSSSLGVGYLLPLLAFLAGTVGMGTVLVLGGKWLWNRPLWLPRAFGWVNQRLTVFPVAAGVVLGLRFLLRLS